MGSFQSLNNGLVPEQSTDLHKTLRQPGPCGGSARSTVCSGTLVLDALHIIHQIRSWLVASIRKHGMTKRGGNYARYCLYDVAN